MEDGYTVNRAAVYHNGTMVSGLGEWNATTTTEIFRPTGSIGGGGGGASRIGGYALLAGVGFVACRRFGNGQLGRVASTAIERVRSLV